MERFLVINFLFLLFSAQIIAQDWFVCIGSYRDEKGAAKKIQELEELGYKTFAGKVEIDNKTLYRIFYEKKFSSLEEAIDFKNSIESLPEYNSIYDKNLWCTEYYGQKYKVKDSKTEKINSINNSSSSSNIVIEQIEVVKEIPVEKIVEVEKEVPVVVIEQVEKIVEKKVPVIVVQEVEKIVEKEVPVVVIEQVEKIVEVEKEVIKEVPKIVEKEVIKEVVKEVPKIVEVEKIVEKEVIKEVPKIVEKEVPSISKIENENSKTQNIENKKQSESPLKILIIRDSDTGKPINSAEISVDEHWKVNSDKNGVVILPDEISDGNHKIFITASDYATIEQSLVVKDSEIVGVSQFSLPKAVDYERIKIALEWDKSVQDLDARVICNKKQIYFKNRSDEGVTIERDSRTFPGVEVMTIEKADSKKIYSYYVTDNDNYGSNTSNKLSKTDAKVTIWFNNDYYTTIKIPENKMGFNWHVFDVVNGEVVLVNSITIDRMKSLLK